jgi:hypothetical protein
LGAPRRRSAPASVPIVAVRFIMIFLFWVPSNWAASSLKIQAEEPSDPRGFLEDREEV